MQHNTKFFDFNILAVICYKQTVYENDFVVYFTTPVSLHAMIIKYMNKHKVARNLETGQTVPICRLSGFSYTWLNLIC